MSCSCLYSAVRFKFREEYCEPEKLISLLHSKNLFMKVKEMEDFYEAEGDLKIVWNNDNVFIDKVVQNVYHCDDVDICLSGSDFKKSDSSESICTEKPNPFSS